MNPGFPNDNITQATQATHEKTAALTVQSPQTRSIHSGSPSGISTSRLNISPASSSPKQKVARDKDLINFIIQWTCGILAAAAAIVFGIWAPLSYKATASGNHSNDAAQSSMVDALSTVSDMAWTANNIAMTATRIAMSAATAQSSALTEMHNRMALMGQLAVIDFCNTQTTLAACSSYIESGNLALTSLVDMLGSPNVLTRTAGSTGISTSYAIVDPQPTTTAAASSSFPSSSHALHHRPALSVEAVLFIVFGSVIAAGTVVAFLIWRYRYARKLSRKS